MSLKFQIKNCCSPIVKKKKEEKSLSISFGSDVDGGHAHTCEDMTSGVCICAHNHSFEDFVFDPNKFRAACRLLWPCAEG